MTGRCTFCPNDSHTSLWVKDYSDGQDPAENEVVVCIECLESFEAVK